MKQDPFYDPKKPKFCLEFFLLIAKTTNSLFWFTQQTAQLTHSQIYVYVFGRKKTSFCLIKMEILLKSFRFSKLNL